MIDKIPQDELEECVISIINFLDDTTNINSAETSDSTLNMLNSITDILCKYSAVTRENLDERLVLTTFSGALADYRNIERPWEMGGAQEFFENKEKYIPFYRPFIRNTIINDILDE